MTILKKAQNITNMIKYETFLKQQQFNKETAAQADEITEQD